MFKIGFGKKRKQGPPGPRPTPKPRSEYAHLAKEDPAAMNPQIEDEWKNFKSDRPKPCTAAVTAPNGVRWLGEWSLFSGELRAYFMFDGTEYVVRLTDFMGTLTDAYKVTLKAMNSINADAEYQTTHAQAEGDIQLRLDLEHVTLTIAPRPLHLNALIGD